MSDTSGWCYQYRRSGGCSCPGEHSSETYMIPGAIRETEPVTVGELLEVLRELQSILSDGFWAHNYFPSQIDNLIANLERGAKP